MQRQDFDIRPLQRKEPQRETAATGSGLAAALGIAAGLVSFAWAWRPSYWYDEAATLSAIDRSPSELWHMLARVDAVHGVYYFAARAWAGQAGTGEAVMRLPSAVGVALACAGTAVLAQRLVGRHLALAAGIIAVVLPGLSWSGGEARVYAWSALAAVIVNLALLRALEDGSSEAWFLYALALTLAGYVFLYTLLLVPAHAVTLLLLRRWPRGWLVAALFSLIATAPMTWLAWMQRAQVGWIKAALPRLVGKALVGQNFLGPRPGSPLRLPVVCAVLSLLLSVVLCAIAIRSGRQDPRTAVAVAIAAPWAFVPPLLMLAASAVAFPLYQERYATFCAPGLALLLGLGVRGLSEQPQLMAAAVAALVLLSAPALAQQKTEDAKAGQDYRRLAAAVGPRGARADGVVLARFDARGVLVAYPDEFRHATLLNVADTPARTGSLWGHVLPARALSPAAVAGRRIAMLTATSNLSTGSRYDTWLTRHGCWRDGDTVAGHFSVRLYRC